MGILTMAGKGVRVLTTPTSDLGKILACMHGESSERDWKTIFLTSVLLT